MKNAWVHSRHGLGRRNDKGQAVVLRLLDSMTLQSLCSHLVVVICYICEHRWAAPQYFFSTSIIGTLEKSTGTAVSVLLFLNF